MEIDYNSFIHGVLTGLKLPRISEDRVPPLPEGMYMITEEEERMITESGDYMITE